MATEQVLKLSNGRMIGYGLYGNPQGIPILDFHGIPGSRREAALVAERVGRDDICVIGFDRPGYGRSTPQSRFRIVDIPPIVTALADALAIDRLIGLGYSGGGPFALACARWIPARFSAIGIVSGVGPAEIGSQGMHAANRKKFNLARSLPGLARLLLRAGFAPLRGHREKLAQQLTKIWQQMPDPDRQVLADRQIADAILQITEDAICQTTSGWVQEEILMASAWQFELQDIHGPPVYLWHGAQDRNVPLAMAQAVASQIPGCQAAFLPGEGHLSLIFRHGRQIVDTLVNHA